MADQVQYDQSIIKMLTEMGLPEAAVIATLRELSEAPEVGEPLAESAQEPAMLHSAELLEAMVEAAIDLSHLPADLRRAIEDRRRKQSKTVRREPVEEENVISLYEAEVPPDRAPPKPSPFNR
jgi:hypothetical protein